MMSMRVAFLVKSFPSVSETFVLNQITGLIDLGHEVDVHAYDAGGESQIHPDLVTYDLMSRTWYVPEIPKERARRVGKALRLLLPHLSFATAATTVRSLNVFADSRRAMSLKTLYDVIPFIQWGRCREYDIVHGQFGPYGLKGLSLKKNLGWNSKLVVSFRGYDLSRYIAIHGCGVYRNLFKQADLILPVCESFKRKLIELGCDERNVIVHHSGINCDNFSFSRHRISPCQPIQVVTVARLVEKKGVEFGLRAIARFVRQSNARGVSYVIVGEGPLRPRLESDARGLGVSKYVRFVGWQDSRAVRRILKESHIMLAPSVTTEDEDQEGIPNVLKEAMAMGVPVVTTSHSGIPELVQDGVSGFLTPERDYNAIADKINYIIENPQITEDIAANARGIIEVKFNTEVLNRRLVALYSHILNGGTASNFVDEPHSKEVVIGTRDG